MHNELYYFDFCSKIPHHNDACIRAQEKLQPTCAKNSESYDASSSSGVGYPFVQPACHTVAEMCRDDIHCRYVIHNIIFDIEIQ